jgi:hypothetical protein
MPLQAPPFVEATTESGHARVCMGQNEYGLDARPARQGFRN